MPIVSTPHLRAYQPSDAPAAVALLNAEAQHTLGFQRAVLDSVGHLRLQRYVPRTSAAVVALDTQAQVCAYAYLADREQRVVYEIGGAVHPDAWGHGLGGALLQWGLTQATALSAQAPAGVQTVLQAILYADEQRAHRLCTRHGYAHVRTWSHLVVELDALPPTPHIPDGLTLRAVDLDADWDALGPAMDAAYADHWGTLRLPAADALAEPDVLTPSMPTDESYSNTPGFCFALMASDEVAGGILCNAKLIERADTGRVGSVFVRPAYRRRGVGHALMHAALRAFWEHGLRRVITDTDADSFTAAPRLYTSVGMRAYRQEYVYERIVRAGREMRRLVG